MTEQLASNEQTLAETISALESACEHGERCCEDLVQVHVGHISAALRLLRASVEPSEVRHGPCPCCGTEWTPNVAPIARVEIIGGEVSQTEIYAPGLPDGAHDLFPVPLERAPASEPPSVGWISVHDRLPVFTEDPREHVLVYSATHDWLGSQFTVMQARDFYWPAEGEQMGTDDASTVTHWMPLPGAPVTKTVVCERCRATKADDCYFAEDPPANCAHRPAVEKEAAHAESICERCDKPLSTHSLPLNRCADGERGIF